MNSKLSLFLAFLCFNPSSASDPLCADLVPDVVFLFPSELSCSEYYHCLNGDLTIMHCENGLWFSALESACVDPAKSDCQLETPGTTEQQPETTSLPTVVTSTTTEIPTTPTITPEPTTPQTTTTDSPTTPTTTPEPTTAQTTTTDSPTTPTTTTENPTTETTTWPNTPTPDGNGVICPADGTAYFPHPSDCKKYFECFHGNSYEMQCPPHFFWSNKRQICVSMEESDCRADPTCDDVADGDYAIKGYPRDCEKYLECFGKTGTVNSCDDGYYFDEIVQSCNFAELVECPRN